MRFSGDNADLPQRSRKYAVRIIKLYCALAKTTELQVMGKQLLRAGTSVGAQIAEATYAKSRADFISKMQGALQELCESKYWLELLVEAEFIKRSRIEDLYDETNQLMAIITAIVGKSAKNKER